MTTEKKRVEVVATKGEEIRRLIWIEQLPDGSFYYGPVIPKIDIHSSFHASGTVHFFTYHEPKKWQKLSDFRGITCLCTIGVGKDLGELRYKPFTARKLDGVVYIDFRSMKKDTVNIHLFLVEPGHLEHLKGVFSALSQDNQLAVFTVTEPWLAVTAHSM